MKFSLLPEREKRESIVGLRDIVCGIRIFNKDAGHCGEGLIDSACLIQRPFQQLMIDKRF